MDVVLDDCLMWLSFKALLLCKRTLLCRIIFVSLAFCVLIHLGMILNGIGPVAWVESTGRYKGLKPTVFGLRNALKSC